MCRLFGLIASPNRVHASFWLLEAADSLIEQSLKNPDGTGLGYFAPVVGAIIDKEPLPAYEDPAFAREAKHVSSTTFVSHIRYATTGDRTTENTHPFAIDGMLFAHNGMLQGLDTLETRLGRDMHSVGGDTDSERYFALVAKEIRARGNVGAGISAAVSWIAENLPVYSMNFVLATASELWAFRYPETHRLFVLERRAGGGDGRRDLHHVSGTMRVHVPDLRRHPSVVVASEPLDDTAGWRPLESGELIRVGPDLLVRSSIVVDRRPAQLIRLDDSTRERIPGRPAASRPVRVRRR
jgi:predicted glutamine amidotransferase